MKVLFVHGLKLGDLLMAAPVLQFYRRKYPRAEFHLLALPEAMAASQVLDPVNVWHELPKKKILETAALASVGLLDGVDLLAACFDRLNLENFDLAVSLSHTRFCAYALSLICASEKHGTYFEGENLKCSSLDFLEMENLKETRKLHYLDAYRKGFGSFDEKVEWRFRGSEEDTLQKRSLLNEGRSLYLFQPLSSEVKKAWSLERWTRLMQEIRRMDPLAEMKILCAPFEVGEVQALSQAAQVELLPTDLKEALAWIRAADFLITLDTSIKHLANASRCKVIELCLGSADFFKQAIYKPGAVILTPKVSCYPCAHQSRCPLEKRICAQGIEAEDVIQALKFLKNKEERPSIHCGAFITTTTDTQWSYRALSAQGGKNEKAVSRTEAEQNH